MLQAEFAVLDFIQNNLRCGFLDFIIPKITRLGDAGILWIILTVIFLLTKKYRKTGIVMAIALAVDLICCNIIIKPLVARTRPYDINTAVKLLIPAQIDYSFPSGHTAASFASAAAMYYSGCRFWKAALVIAVIIGFSRLYLYVHFPTDVLAGALLGVLFGYIGFKIFQKISNRKNNLIQ